MTRQSEIDRATSASCLVADGDDQRSAKECASGEKHLHGAANANLAERRQGKRHEKGRRKGNVVDKSGEGEVS